MYFWQSLFSLYIENNSLNIMELCTSSIIHKYQKYKLLIFTKSVSYDLSQPAIACSKLTIETLEQGVKYVQS